MEKVNYEIERNRGGIQANPPFVQGPDSGTVNGTINAYLRDTVEWNKENLTLIRNLFSIISGDEYVDSPAVHADIDEVTQDSIYGLVWIIRSQSMLISDIVKRIKERIG